MNGHRTTPPCLGRSSLPAAGVPWEFSATPAPGDPTVENLPTPEGWMLGREISRLCDIEEERLRERFPRQHPRCADCALRLGTRPNGCAETLMDILKCLYEHVPFYCHKGLRDGEPRRLCAGYAILVGAELPGVRTPGQFDASGFATSDEAP